MDISRAFTFVTKDERWVGKIGIGALVSLLGFLIIPIPLLWGYMVGVARNVKDGALNPMPEWDDWGRLFKDGLAIMVAQFVYTLPFWLLSCVAGAGIVGMGSLTEISEEAATAGVFGIFGLTTCLVLLFVFMLLFVSPAIVIQYVRTDDFGSVFRVGEVFGIAIKNIGNILLIMLAMMGVGIVFNIIIGILGIIPCIGWLIAVIVVLAFVPYKSVAIGHLYGQLAEQANRQ